MKSTKNTKTLNLAVKSLARTASIGTPGMSFNKA